MVEIDEITLLLIAFVILLIPLPLISFGTMEDIPILWWLGIGLLIVGGLIPTISRYVMGKNDQESP